MADQTTDDPLKLPKISEEELAGRVEELMKHVDPTLVHRFTPIDPAKNAWPLWEKAIDAYSDEPFDDEFSDAYSDLMDHGMRPAPQVLERFRKWSSGNQTAMALFDQGIALGAFESPKAGVSVRRELEVLHLGNIRQLARQKETDAALAMLDGKTDVALQFGYEILDVARILLASECLLVDFLVGVSLVGFGAGSICRSAIDVHATEMQARNAVDVLGKIQLDAPFRRALSTEFCRWFLPDVAVFPKSNDPRELARYKVMKEWSYTTDFTEEGRKNRLEEIENCAIVFAGHPKLFDRVATTKDASSYLNSYFSELDKPAVQRSDYLRHLQQELMPWPANTIPDPFPGFFSGRADEEPLTADRMARARDALRDVDNLVGKLLIWDAQKNFQVYSNEKNFAHINARRLLIALCHHERQHRALPDSLDLLVAADWFPSVPLDPYDRKPFRYSAEDRLLWSVGRDGKNDGPAKLKDGRFVPGEFSIDPIWHIPPVPEL